MTVCVAVGLALSLLIHVQRNLSPRGAKLCKTVVSTLAKFSETIVFLLIGYGEPRHGAPVCGAPVCGAPVRSAPVRGAAVRGAAVRGALSQEPPQVACRYVHYSRYTRYAHRAGFWLYTLGHTSTSIAARYGAGVASNRSIPLPDDSPCRPPSLGQVRRVPMSRY